MDPRWTAAVVRLNLRPRSGVETLVPPSAALHSRNSNHEGLHDAARRRGGYCLAFPRALVRAARRDAGQTAPRHLPYRPRRRAKRARRAGARFGADARRDQPGAARSDPGSRSVHRRKRRRRQGRCASSRQYGGRSHVEAAAVRARLRKRLGDVRARDRLPAAGRRSRGARARRAPGRPDDVARRSAASARTRRYGPALMREPPSRVARRNGRTAAACELRTHDRRRHRVRQHRGAAARITRAQHLDRPRMRPSPHRHGVSARHPSNRDDRAPRPHLTGRNRLTPIVLPKESLMTSVSLTGLDALATKGPATALDDMHIGDIEGALGTIRRGDAARGGSWWKRLRLFLVILGPGLIVMVGDNDAGAFSTYAQAAQNYGTTLLWTLLLLVPVLYLNQEMALRLGAVTGVGHARLILERFGKFWGAFSVIDLFILNALTIVTEFIGISLAVSYLGLPKVPTVIVAAITVIGAVSTGSFRRFERLCLMLVAFSLLVIPVVLVVHPPIGQVARDVVVPGFPHGAPLSTVMLLVIAIVGTTVAPWQLFFQQSYVIDKRITPRWINYERVDLVIGIVIVIVGGIAIMAMSAAAFGGHAGFGQFTDAGGTAA